MADTTWLAVGEGLIGFVVGVLVGVVYVLVRVVTGNGRRRDREDGDTP